MIILMSAGILLKFTYLLTVCLWLTILRLTADNYEQFRYEVANTVTPTVENTYLSAIWFTGGFICVDVAILV